LINIVGASNLTLAEVNAAATIVQGVAHADANIIFGSVIDESMGEAVKVTVIAAGFDGRPGSKSDATPTPSVTVQQPAMTEPSPTNIFAATDDFDFGDDDDLPSFLRP
jgi:cell division protein FtsZ